MIHIDRRQIGVAFAAIAGLVLVFFVAERYWPLGPDYYYHYRPLADEWISGSWDMYSGRLYLAYPPWSAVVIAPLGLLPLESGKAALFVFTLVCIGASLRLIYGRWRIPPWVLFASLANLFTFDALLRGQLDGVVLLGMVLAWWAARNRRPWLLSFALCVATIKPPINVALPLLVILFELRHWPRREIVAVAVLPILSVVGAFAVFGLNWPVDFLHNLQGPINYLSISIWRAATSLGLSPVWIAALCVLIIILVAHNVWRSPLELRSLSIAVAANMLITPYANGDHYVLLIPAFAYVAQQNWRWSVVAYILSYTPLLRVPLGYDAAIADLLFPVVLLACAWLLTSRTETRADKSTAQPASIAS